MIRAILVDDEPLAINHMEKKLTELGTVEVVKTFSNASSVLKEMKHLDFRVAFLDIEMPGLNGLDLAELIQDWDSTIIIVFVTAYREYAIDAFELHSIDYLMKPILSERLKKTITRIQEKIQLNEIQVSSTTNTAPSIRIVCFDEFIMYHNDIPVKWKTSKAKELFAFFIAHHNEYVNRDTIIDLIWPENDYQKAKTQLHTSMSYLRSTLNSLGYPNVIEFLDQNYILKLPNLQCDSIDFIRMINDSPTVHKGNIQDFEQIVEGYHGNFMERNGYEWALLQAQSILQKLVQLLQKMITYYSESNNLDKKQRYLVILLQYNPYSENVLQQLMHHYVQIGNRGDAVKAYHEFTKVLLNDLGILPEHETNSLYDSILQGNPIH
ncbi:response regulator [Sporosarcina siberiensis]|uniref:Response regulator n=1 Tax=Sporosarcina siberiensis TaxID=1365606 RepID=A0ABW4SG31_9BACL